MGIAVKCAWVGNKILSFIAMVLVLIMLLYGGYSLWNTIMIYRGAFSSNDLLKYQPTGDGPNSITLGELMKLNKDVVGWIKIFDTHISYPVVQGKDNQEYLNKDVFGEFSFSGSIFLDYRNACDFTDSYSIIYGHHMEYGAMFGDVVEFKNDDYFQEHKTGALFLLDDTYKITLFACVETQEFNNKIYNPIVQGKDNLDTLLKYIKDEAVQYRDISLNHDDKIIGLSTCAEAGTNERVVLFGRLDK
ncbi:class B sortase [uncultured Eubacterium sp.]|uniref:class B sortase n=1 Tax=uncultured Eubacterium sp. TaxID=165185 RepID=UPI00259358CF|nr:class B sortase [uncultured Eubacterium sp.]